MRSKILVPFLAALLALAFCLPALAQDGEKNDNMAIVWVFDIKDDQEDAFEEAVKAFHRDFMADKEGAFHWDWYNVLTGPNTGRYIARSGGHNWADLDAEYDWEDEVDAYIEANISPYIDHAERYMSVGDNDIHNYPEDWSNMRYINLEEWHVSNGMGRKFNEGLKTIHGHLKEGDFPVYYAFSYNASGGKGNTVTLATFHENWASMAEPSPSFGEIMVEAMGEEEFQSFIADWSSTFKTGRTWTVVHRQDLSHFDDE